MPFRNGYRIFSTRGFFRSPCTATRSRNRNTIMAAVIPRGRPTIASKGRTSPGSRIRALRSFPLPPQCPRGPVSPGIPGCCVSGIRSGTRPRTWRPFRRTALRSRGRSYRMFCVSPNPLKLAPRCPYPGRVSGRSGFLRIRYAFSKGRIPDSCPGAVEPFQAD